jgi:hypothetical protein
MTDEDRTSQALALHQAGTLVAAAQLYARILDADPGHAHIRQQLTSIEAYILLYLDIGIDPFTYYLSFARPPPVQAVCVDHPDTTGVPNIDYFLTTKCAEPADWPEHY